MNSSPLSGERKLKASDMPKLMFDQSSIAELALHDMPRKYPQIFSSGVIVILIFVFPLVLEWRVVVAVVDYPRVSGGGLIGGGLLRGLRGLLRPGVVGGRSPLPLPVAGGLCGLVLGWSYSYRRVDYPVGYSGAPVLGAPGV